MNKYVKKALIILAIIIALVPLGLLTDAPAWGEWDNDFYKKNLGFIPEGIAKAKEFIHPLLPDYSLPGTNDVIGYYISAIVGSVLIFGIFYLIGKAIAKKHDNN